MIQPFHPASPSGGTGQVVAATPSKPAPQKAHGYTKLTAPQHQSGPYSQPKLIGVVSFKRQGVRQQSLEPLSP
ncbi:MAG: hypothetical protein AAGD43_27495 [Pseudomonadota bacterium]